MNFRFATSLLSQVSLREKFYIVSDILLTKLHAAIPAEYRHLRLFLRDLELSGAEISRHGDANLLRVKGWGGKSYSVLARRRSSDANVVRQVILAGEYAPLVELIAQKWSLDRVRTIVDAGANVGYASIFLLAQMPGAKCYAIEPDAANFRMLEENFRINQFNYAYPIQAALWRANKNLSLRRDFRDGAAWSVRAEQSNGADPRNQVRGMTLRQIMADHAIAEIDVLKVDIEGAEADVFTADAGAGEFLPKVKFLAMELHEETGRNQEILNLLREHHFEMSCIGETYIGFNRSHFSA